MLPLAGTPRPDVPEPAAAASPEQVLATWFAEDAADTSGLQPRLLRLADGRGVPLPVSRWAGPATACDETLLSRVQGPVLDVGCGPGRLTAALHRRGVDVLGLEVLPEVPVLVRGAGAPLHVGDVFAPVPRTGEWRTVLLADGNVGIGGDPAALLRRVRTLLPPAGTVLLELHPAAEAPLRGRVRLEGLGHRSAWFGWGLVGTAALPAVAASGGFTVTERWSAAGREFAALSPA